MSTISITLMSDICIGNGSSTGSAIDRDICTDRFGIPYLPARRVTGCLRAAAEELLQLGYDKDSLKGLSPDPIQTLFGNPWGESGLLRVDDGRLPGVEAMHGKIEAFRKAQDSTPAAILRRITSDRIVGLYTTVRGQTRLENGLKADGSLRFTRVLNHYDPLKPNAEPLRFVCPVSGDESLGEEEKRFLENVCLTLRHLGTNRTRGLGRVETEYFPDPAPEKPVPFENDAEACGEEDDVRVTYTISLDAPVTLPGAEEVESGIPARSVIGCFSEIYLGKHKDPDETFRRLFLDGTVRWSALTPVIGGVRSDPAPLMLLKLKNSGGRLINRFSKESTEGKKPMALSGYYASFRRESGTYSVNRPEIVSEYHNALSDPDGGLYVQDAIEPGLLYGGEAILPKSLLPAVKELFDQPVLRFGRSRKTQYARCTIRSAKASEARKGKTQLRDGEPFYAILKSDLVLMKNAAFTTDENDVREAICAALGLDGGAAGMPEGGYDICQYRVIGGFHGMWHMQKPKVRVVRAGSVFCFAGRDCCVDSEIPVGEFKQEGFGLCEVVNAEDMKKRGVISGTIDHAPHTEDQEIGEAFRNEILLDAAVHAMEERTLEIWDKIRKGEGGMPQRGNIPGRQLRTMLRESGDLRALRNAVERMKTSDVSSESRGRKAAAVLLLDQVYGEAEVVPDFGKLIGDPALWNEIRNTAEVVNKLNSGHWKDPLFTLIHELHYSKGER